jgi:hypothetical protein
MHYWQRLSHQQHSTALPFPPSPDINDNVDAENPSPQATTPCSRPITIIYPIIIDVSVT